MPDPGVVNRLYELIRDKDPIVIVNAVRALEEILAVTLLFIKS